MALIPERNRAVIRGTNEIVVIDYEQGILFRRLAFPGTIGHFALARYGGNWELYVPCSDGNIYICDAADPVILETIPVGPSLVSAAANSKGWIAVSTTDYYDPVKIYRRQTLTRLNSLNDFNTWSARLFFWSDYSLFAVSAYTSPSMMSLYNLNEQGVFLSETDDPYGYQYEKSVTLVRISDRYVVTSSSGHVFSLPDLTYQNTLSAAGTDQMDFQFSEDGNTIYSSMAIERNLFKSVLSNGKIINTERIPTIGYTWLLARDKDEMVVLSASQPFSKYSTPGSFIIETVALK
jgi:hypothetical protein